MPFSSDGDLLLQDAAVSTLLSGAGAHELREVAEERMLHDLGIRWYRREAESRGVCWQTYPMDDDRLEATQLKLLSIYATLAHIYTSQRRASREPDGMERRAAEWQEKYESELKALATHGVSYDWDGVGGITDTEKAARQPRRLRAYK